MSFIKLTVKVKNFQEIREKEIYKASTDDFLKLLTLDQEKPDQDLILNLLNKAYENLAIKTENTIPRLIEIIDELFSDFNDELFKKALSRTENIFDEINIYDIPLNTPIEFIINKEKISFPHLNDYNYIRNALLINVSNKVIELNNDTIHDSVIVNSISQLLKTNNYIFKNTENELADSAVTEVW
ncbi:hypothetical protein [Metabacillus fastidiosus]|uniref:hypothetical protein n=1 Tax=Metabacillus fastidiosus TaxID=1458 RepID=UPI00082481C1|nr:hypothetical protein [Metabacillus fastidiosus]MED4461837.1 hypothetical protein [Metabacillus fastidiosus]